MQIPQVTVYIASHNYGRYLEKAIESVLSQSYESWELLIINDNSSDNTTDVMNLYAHDPRVRVFSTNGIGLLGVCNLALKEAKGEYIIRLDGDDLFDENILLVLTKALENNPKAAMVFPDFYLIDEFGKIFSHERRDKIYESDHVNDLPPNGACTLARTEVLREVGGYDENLNAQDGYYIWTKVIQSHKCINVNLPLFFYRRHGANLTGKSHQIFEARRKIKKNLIVSSIGEFRPIIAVIPCREHYDFAPNLWNQKINGLTLLEKKIETCLASEILDYVVVASDTRDVLSTISKYDDPRLKFCGRDRKDTIRSKSIVPSLELISEQLDPNQTGLSVICYNQSPFVSTDTIEEAISTLIVNRADSSIAVQEVELPVYTRSPYGLIQVNDTKQFARESQKVYVEAQTVVASRNRVFPKGALLGPTVVHFLVDNDEAFFINSAQSLKIGRAIEENKYSSIQNAEVERVDENDVEPLGVVEK